jgi:hypothetical protein
MKTIKYIFFVAMATLLMAADCSNKDSEFYNDVFVSADNLVTVKTSVSSEREVSIKAKILRLLPVSNIPNKKLDIFKTTGGATRLTFSFELEKENTDGTWDFIEFLPTNLSTISGESQVGSFVLAQCVYDGTNSYDYEARIKGLSSGNYRLSFGYNSTATNIIEFRSESTNNNLFLNLNSIQNPSNPVFDPSILVSDGSGNYRFTIN